MRGGVLGIVLIGLGVVLLLSSRGVLNVDWDVVWRLWPAILIYLGLVRIVRAMGV
jgi:hypothetical protein